MTAIATIAEDPRQQWRTPRPLFDALHGRYRFDVDAAADDTNNLLPLYWCVRHDGLALLDDRDSAALRAWVNPPYNNITSWISRAYYRCVMAGSFSALLLPARPDQVWWHRYAMRGELHFFRGRIQFGAPDGVAASSNREPSVLVVFDPNTLGESITRSLDAKTGVRL
jgi:phage N-6-adenine-methyltransferase